MNQTLILGIDMAKQEFVATIRVDDVEEELGVFANDAGGHQSLHEQVSARSDTYSARRFMSSSKRPAAMKQDWSPRRMRSNGW